MALRIIYPVVTELAVLITFIFEMIISTLRLFAVFDSPAAKSSDASVISVLGSGGTNSSAQVPRFPIASL